MDEEKLAGHLRAQEGVISRAQVLAADGCDDDIARLLRRREWARVLPGVYVDHTGPLSWQQRAWSALLFAWPAALAGESALQAFDVRRSVRAARNEGADVVIHVAVARHRRVEAPDWVRVTRLKDFDQRVLENLAPPRTRLDEALVLVASEQDTDDAAIAVLADACQTRRTTAQRLADRVTASPRLRRRALLLEVLVDVASGAYSALEARYLRDVERAHGLPAPARQRAVVVGAKAYRDVDYPEFRTVVELDGRLGHEEARDRWADLDRDVASAVDGDLTLRIGWKQVLEPCRLAKAVAALLKARGWDGTSRPCSPECTVERDSGGPSAHGAGSPPLSA